LSTNVGVRIKRLVVAQSGLADWGSEGFASGEVVVGLYACVLAVGTVGVIAKYGGGATGGAVQSATGVEGWVETRADGGEAGTAEFPSGGAAEAVVEAGTAEGGALLNGGCVEGAVSGEGTTKVLVRGRT